jgi:nitroimidazol reductase NimA-like FMN-containing flavoprotein (pyridoxamine 5'-phosphate oxidase superfamily)
MIGKLTNPQMDEVLHNNRLGRLGCNDGKLTYIVPVSYVYDGRNIICHAVPGQKIRIMRKNPSVCFLVDEIRNFTSWKSVICWGEYEELTDEWERFSAMKLFVDRTMKLKISETAVPPEISGNRVHPRSPGNIKPVIYRIIIREKTGRYESP